jgi:hypothetical protein
MWMRTGATSGRSACCTMCLSATAHCCPRLWQAVLAGFLTLSVTADSVKQAMGQFLAQSWYQSDLA